MSSSTAGLRRLIAIGAAIAVAVALAGCAPASSGSPETSDELNIAYSGGPGTLDPALINQSAQWYVDLAYSPLIQAASDGTLRPSLATEWQYLGDDNTQFELTLREDVKFSDGSELTAEGVKAHFEYVAGAGGQMGAILAGATFSVVDDLTIQVNLAAPNPSLATFFSQAGVGLADVISPEGLKNPEALGTTTFGAGPYMLDTSATVADDHYVYIPNPNYWDKDNVHWNKVTIKVIANNNSVLNALKSGQADFALADYTTAAEAESAGLTVHFVPNVFSGLNLLDRSGTLVPALADVRVRQAINYAIDRDAIVKAIYGDYGTATTQTTQDVGHQDKLDDFYAYDPEKAKSLLAAAGYEDGFEFTVVSTPVFNGDTMVQAIAGQLAEVGITINQESIADGNEWVTKMASGEYPAAWIGYGSQSLHVQGPGLYLPNALFNAFHSEDEELSALFDQLAVASADDVQQVSEDLETRLVELAWWAPVAWAPLGTYTTSKVDPEAVTTTTGQNPIAAIIDLKPAE